VLTAACYWPSLCFCSEVCVRVGGVRSQPFTVDVRVRQGCVLSPLFFTVYMNCTDSHSRINKGVVVGSCLINRMLFADECKLLAPSEMGLQPRALDRFSVPCDQAGNKISTNKTEEILCLSRNPRKFTLQVSGNTYTL